MKTDRCAFLLSTCDSYSDTWDPFFELMNKYWPDIPYRVFINTENNEYDSKFNFEIITCNTNRPVSWSQRLINTLSQIEAEYIFIVLDDFFLKGKVDNNVFNQLLDIMDRDNNIASFQLKAARLMQEGHLRDAEKLFISEVDGSGWKTHFVPTIWRKSILLKWLRKHESIWGFELYGSQRARLWKYKHKVYSVESPLVYDYLWIEGCSVIVNGKWLASSKVDEFFIENNIDINLELRGRISIDEYRSRTIKDTLKKLTLKQIFLKSILRVRSLW